MNEFDGLLSKISDAAKDSDNHAILELAQQLRDYKARRLSLPKPITLYGGDGAPYQCYRPKQIMAFLKANGINSKEYGK